MKWHGDNQGFTLVELMFSMALFSMAVVFLYSTFVVNTRMYSTENEVLEMQQSTRTAVDDLSRSVFMAGSVMPKGAIPSDLGYLYAIMTGFGGTDSPDTLTFMKGVTQVQTYLTESMPEQSAILNVDDASMFSPGDVVIIQGNTLECGESLEFFEVTQISTNGQNTLQHAQSLPWNTDQLLNCSYMTPATMTKVEFIKYYIDNSDPLHPTLMKVIDEHTPEAIAADMENLKVTYDLVSGDRGVSVPPNPNLIRKLNFFIVGRTGDEDNRWTGGVHSLTGQTDGYRRYCVKTNVYVRNLES